MTKYLIRDREGNTLATRARGEDAVKAAKSRFAAQAADVATDSGKVIETFGVPFGKPDGSALFQTGSADPNTMERIAVVVAHPAPELADMPETDLYREAKAEHAAIKEWKQAGSTGEAPATPHLTELNTRKAAGRKVVAKARTERTSSKPELYVKALEAKKQGKRGKGVKVTDDELTVAATDLATRGLTQNQALEVAYWINRLAVTRQRWAKAWVAAEAARKAS